jgi:hypothetical protein
MMIFGGATYIGSLLFVCSGISITPSPAGAKVDIVDMAVLKLSALFKLPGDPGQ